MVYKIFLRQVSCRLGKAERSVIFSAPRKCQSCFNKYSITALAELESPAQGYQLSSIGLQSISLLAVFGVHFLHVDHKNVCAGHVGGESFIDDSLRALEREFASTVCAQPPQCSGYPSVFAGR
jgi:hypothetical protein